MDIDSRRAIAEKRVDQKMQFTYGLLEIAFVLFTFIIALSPELVRENILLALQLSLSIPLYFSSIFLRAKITAHPTRPLLWEQFGFYTFIVAYSFTINVVGILLADLVSVDVALWFWAANILSAFMYSVLEIYGNEASFEARVRKDFCFMGMLIVFGVLPVLGVY